MSVETSVTRATAGLLKLELGQAHIHLTDEEANKLYGQIRQVLYYPDELTDEEVAGWPDMPEEDVPGVCEDYPCCDSCSAALKAGKRKLPEAQEEPLPNYRYRNVPKIIHAIRVEDLLTTPIVKLPTWLMKGHGTLWRMQEPLDGRLPDAVILTNAVEDQTKWESAYGDHYVVYDGKQYFSMKPPLFEACYVLYPEGDDA